jgi:translation initiation factor IF-3
VILDKDDVETNEKIRASRVILIDEEGRKLGEFSKFDALKRAEEVGLDLVSVSSGDVPICKLLDYGKLKYQNSKKQKEAAQKSTKIVIKELQLSPVTEINDLNVIANKAKAFLEQDYKVKLVVKSKGRLSRYSHLAQVNAKIILDQLNAKIESEQRFPDQLIFLLTSQ